eukprot:TRINITY_DN4029_c0_g1_i1.p1 TRINITY_DN4029_c0_g1~~TRINITY_DN4029_c0_g1_i1.p1  ORF type:complete len:282 (-),score=24.56 TRINITY_DN4029_c0_g1_i1:97-942(-)
MRILVSGASGFVAGHLILFLESQGHTVFRLSRSAQGSKAIRWNVEQGTIDEDALERAAVEAVVHLAGENVVGVWTAAKKHAILTSRTHGTRLLCEALARLPNPPSLFISASGHSIYGSDTHGQQVDETSPRGAGFLADVTEAWEAAAEPIRAAGVRLVHMRIGAVLSPDGGMLGVLLLPFKLCLGGVLGDGTQSLAWISMKDMIRAIDFLLNHQGISGPVNMVSPNAVTNYEFTKTLGRVLGRYSQVFPPFLHEHIDQCCHMPCLSLYNLATFVGLGKHVV